MNQHNLPQHRARGTNWYFLGFLAIAGYFLFTEHRAHVLPYLPFLLLLACPLMHFFMHRGHGGHEHGKSGEHGNCCGHQHTSARNSQAEHDALPDNQTKYPDRPA
ncbi:MULTISPECIES: DUF2933 domain-containing protein [Pseudomonas]|uniref:DUF2933 domain-containing protein n=1 Tax=Pseudomonas migulae TaxID=78543 RepID=A0A1H5KR51_9PSED|nr:MULTISPECIES: DUF2933 domain-containing protein [Pseudomonas]TWC59884.1 DUF2933 family protein [Pseudomonas sp. SJZ080]SEE66897.1 Protein of unknown function [Pseudomonas migulae]